MTTRRIDGTISLLHRILDLFSQWSFNNGQYFTTFYNLNTVQRVFTKSPVKNKETNGNSLINVLFIETTRVEYDTRAAG